MTKETTLIEMVGQKQLDLMNRLGEIEFDTNTQKGSREKKMKATTPKNREVEISQIQTVGTCCHSGKLLYGDVPVAYWCTSGSGLKSLEEALKYADEKIDRCGLHE